MTKVEVIQGGQTIPHEVVVTTPWPTEPPPQDTPAIGLVEIDVIDQMIPGSIWTTGDDPPTTPGNVIGDMYLEGDGDIWRWDGTAWVPTGVNISSSDTPEQILAKLVTVDGEGSGLDADTLDGHSSEYFATDADMTAAEENIIGLDDRMDMVEAKNDQQDIALINADTRLDAAEAKNTEQDGRLNNVEAVNTAQNAQITANTTDIDDLETEVATKLDDGPHDGFVYGRKDGDWATVIGGASTDLAPPPGPLQDGQLWFRTDSGALYIWFDDGDTQQWVQVSASPLMVDQNYTRKTAETRNRLRNPAFQISQELAADTVYNSANAYPADQWNVYSVTTGTTAYALRPADLHPDNEAVNWLRLSSTVADAAMAATEYYSVRQPIEGRDMADFKWGTAQALPAVLRFKAHASITGKFCISLRGGGMTFVRLLDIVANTTTLYEIPIPPCTAGPVWPVDNAVSATLNVTIAAGANFIGGVDGAWVADTGIACPGISNWLSVSGQSLDITNVGLHLDPGNTGKAPPFQVPDYAEELDHCKRYYQMLITELIWTSGGAGYYFGIPFIFSPLMRAAPVLATYATGAISNVSTFQYDSALPNKCRLYLTATAAGATQVVNRTGSANARM